MGGSWDCYCAICGGPFCGTAVSQKPRRTAFRERRAKEMENQRQGKEAECEEDHEAEEDDVLELEERYDEDHSYDRDVISAADLEWTETLHVLASHYDPVEERTKAFVSGPGYYNDYGRVAIESGDDPNAEHFDFDDSPCYFDDDDGSAIFPFHWCCYEMLAKCLTGSFNDGGLDKDLLYSIMHELSPYDGTSLSGIDYGDVSDMQDQYWKTLAGYEFVVSHPRNVPGASEVILSMFASGAFRSGLACTDLGSRVLDDPFGRIPYDIIHKISSFIPDEDLVSLARASWHVHALLRNNNQFWSLRLRNSFFPWFFELRDVLEQDQTLLQRNNAQLIFHWAERMTRPKKWLTGPFMGVANRRRIWLACEQLGEIYWSQKEVKEYVSMSDEEKLIRKYSVCLPLVTVSSPEATELDSARKVCWAKTWSEVRSKNKTLESFWGRHGSLVGISLTPDGEERRLLGLADSDDEIVRESVRLGHEEWVHGFIVHMPVPTRLDDCTLMTSPKGLTIILNSGRKSGVGDTSQRHMQRSFLAAPGWCITGINGTTGLVMGNQQLTQLGLVQAQQPDVADYSVPLQHFPLPVPRPLGQLLWDEDYSQVLGQRIQEHPLLRLVGSRSLYRKSRYLHKDLISFGALIWAKDAGELRSLRRLTGCIVMGGTTNKQYVCGVNADYEPTTDLARRVIGIEKIGAELGVRAPDVFRQLEIDGPGGEVVTELGLPLEAYPKALTIRTSRGRTYCWGDAPSARRWERIKAATGETLVGIVVKFGGPDRSCDDADEGLGRHEMSVVAGLSMRLED